VRGATRGVRGRRWLRRQFFEPPAPLVAIEVRPKALAAVRLAGKGGRVSLAAAALVELPPGVLAVSMTESNVHDVEAFRQLLRSVAEKAGILAAGRIALVLPDPVARLALLPAAEVRARRRKESEELLRFRLRKAVPFEIRDARLATVPAGAQGGEAQVLVGAVLHSILAEYEQPCRDLGLEPGLVVLSGPTILEGVEWGRPPEDRLVVNWDDGYLSLLLARAGSPALIRTLSGAAVATSDSVAREVTQTVTYYRERLGGAGLAQVVLRTAALPVEEAAAVLERALGQRPEILDPWGRLHPGDQLSAQGLAGAASLLSRRAA
jgi:type IV pilus assembly protein PilM